MKSKELQFFLSSSASFVAAALRSSVAKLSTLRSVGAVIQPPVRSPGEAGEAALSRAVIGGSAGVSSKDGDTVHLAPSVADRVAHGLGPVVVTVCKPLVFKVSADTDKEIICTSSVFESHGLICRFRGFWPSLPQLHTWISQS
ncbi:hypothetical protein SUGI_0278830 [Cryptomeria japonica]|nr:hypothetical protein SUGI_0278830 [Cryptomeria japonica]